MNLPIKQQFVQVIFLYIKVVGFWVVSDMDVSLPRYEDYSGIAQVTARNSSPTKNYCKVFDVAFGQTPNSYFKCMAWSSYSSSDLESQGWLTQDGVMQFRVEVTVDVDALQQCPAVSNWCPGVCTNMLWRTQEFTDFTIVVQDRLEIQCHRAVLSAASPVFKGMMSGEWQESMQSLERLDVSVKDMSLLLEYIYVGCLPFNVDCSTLLRLAELADYYQLPVLIDQCASRITPLVSKGNVVEMLNYLRVLSQTNSKFESIFHSVMEEVKNDTDLLYIVCMSLQKPVTQGCDLSQGHEGLSDGTQTSTLLGERTLLDHHNSINGQQHFQRNEGAHDDVRPTAALGSLCTSDLNCQSDDVSVTSQCLSNGSTSVLSFPPGLAFALQPGSSDIASCRSDSSALNESIAVAGSSGNSISQAGEPVAQLTRTQANHVTEPPVEPCLKRTRRKTCRGRSVKKDTVSQDQMDLSSIPDTYNSWD